MFEASGVRFRVKGLNLRFKVWGLRFEVPRHPHEAAFFPLIGWVSFCYTICIYIYIYIFLCVALKGIYIQPKCGFH